jgi:chromosome segregation protein
LYLKEVRMENFKSFGRKLSVPFGSGFTAITGPNGSGKSNIGDAILFVLGPRSSKKIRAGRLSELIFNGGRDGKPATECRVSLVFDNTDRLMPIDADEVILTRRVKKAPKPDDPDAYYSYFYVNGRAASLKEFADLLDHARISADGYNIVTQGHVADIVGMGAVDRRRILEQIAGITEFDKDIEKAEKQKQEVESNLEHISIRLEEILRTLRQLKRDRDGALRYKELNEELSKFRGMRAVANKLEMERRIARTQEKIEKLEKERAEAVEKANAGRAQERELVKRIAEVEKRIEETGGEELRELNAELQHLRDEYARRDQDRNYASDEIEEVSKELEEQRAHVAEYKKQYEAIKKEAATHEEHAGNVEEVVKELEAELGDYKESVASTDADAMKIQKDLAELKKEHETALEARHEAQLEQDRVRQNLEALEESLEQLRDEEHRATTDRDEADAELKEVEEASDPQTVKKLEKELFEKKKRQAEISQELKELEAAERTTRQQLADLRAQRDAVAGVERAYSRAVDSVLDARDQGRLKGVCGTIAELGNVDDKYATAIETAAGPRSQSIVVETAKDAQDAIEYLRKNKLGRATFLPLDKLSKSMPRGKALMAVKDNASLGFALDLVRFDKRYEKAFFYVFQDTVVVNRLDDARRLMGGVRLVTLQGDLIESAGAMTGGQASSRKGTSFGGVDTSKIDELSRKLQSIETHTEAMAGELSEVRQSILEIEDHLREAQGTGRELEERTKVLKGRAEQAQKRLDQARQRTEKKEEELERLKAREVELEDALAELSDRLSDMDADKEALSRRLLAVTDKKLADKIKAAEAKLAEAKEQLREAQKLRDVAQDKARLQAERVEESTLREARLQKELTEHQEARESAKTVLAELDKKIEAVEAKVRETSGAVDSLYKERDELKEELNQVKSRIERMVNEAESGYALIAREKENLPALEEGLSEALVELKETEYEHPEEEPLPPMDDLRVEIRRIEQQLRDLGPINQRALEEYEQQEDRKSTLDEEVQRLNEERDKLVELVEEIVKKKKEDFMRVFDAINNNFKQVYTRLSVGGSAYLALENPEDPFDGGLTMMARPRGKRVTRIDALSGGEKGMTALAFIFAVQEYEPSPFYYLDEIDQNLDGVNSDTIGKMVGANSHKAQFIVVSLRKVTLKQADHIYGVTMQRVGLSQIVGDYDVARLRDPDDGSDQTITPIEAITREDQKVDDETRQELSAKVDALTNGGSATNGQEAEGDEETTSAEEEGGPSAQDILDEGTSGDAGDEDGDEADPVDEEPVEKEATV